MDEQFKKDYDRFRNIGFEDFKKLAQDDTLSNYQKIGFPDAYRKESEKFIFEDIVQKLDLKGKENKTLMDIGTGCSDLARYIIKMGEDQNLNLLLIDSKEMLDLLPDGNNIEKHYGYFPDQTENLVNSYTGKVDYIICYSIFHYVFYNTCIFKFLDVAVTMLRPGGKMLIGDIPNVSKRKRFFSTQQGVEYHQQFTNSKTYPEVKHLIIEPGQVDDGVLFGIMQRYRNFGLETYLLPHPKTLPMWNRREDLLIEKN